jgi:hypothetical protein
MPAVSIKPLLTASTFFSFRGNKAFTLTATSFIYDTSRFLSANGTNLSDHHPARVEFSWSLSSSFRQSDMWGGPHG